MMAGRHEGRIERSEVRTVTVVEQTLSLQFTSIVNKEPS